jgi:HK97 gp10 family phage protein
MGCCLMALTIALKGGEKLASNLSELDRRLQTKIVRTAMRKALNEIMRPALISASPKRKVEPKSRGKTKLLGLTKGPLSKSWRVINVAKQRRGVVRFKVESRTRSRDAFYAIFLEQGWLSGRRVLKREIRAANRAGTNVRKRGSVPARPFARQAAEGAFQRVIERVTQETSAQVEAEMKEIVR